MVKDEFYTLYNNVKIPKVGFGTWQLQGNDCYNACMYALKNGYTHIDTAYVYENEHEVARAIKDSGIKREDLFLTTKVPADVKTCDGTIEHFYKSMKALEVDYVDLYLIHAPWPWSAVGTDCTEGNIECWKAIIDLYKKGLVRSIGVSNFHPENIQPLIDATGVVPMVNQIRFFLGNTQEPIVEYCKKNNILVQAYSPLATGEMLARPELDELAKKYNTTKAKISLRYCIEREVLPLPRSTKENHIIDNIDIDFKIDDEDMKYLNSLYHIASTRPFRS